MKFPAPVPVDANGVYHGLEFDDAGTNATRIYLAAQFLASDWVNTLCSGDNSYARDGDFFANLAGQLAAQEPCLHNVTGEALFCMYDKIAAAVAPAHATAEVAASGPGPIRTASVTTARDVGPVRNVGAGTRTAPIFIDDFDDGEGQIVAPPASARATARANAARPY
ncbi:hypothetical protein BGZ88_010597 [Linnemannia elongata]|nr:hypothetical protein BGZ88_010597 [Linnemannia elongata]